MALSSVQLTRDNKLAERANAWVQAEDLIGAAINGERLKRRRTSVSTAISITFVGSSSTFSRAIPKSISLEDLYKIAFRGMRGRHTNFVLTHNSVRLVPSRASSAEAVGIADNDSVNILVFPEGQAGQSSAVLCLTKVYDEFDEMMFGIWTPRNNAHSIRYVLVKYWRYMLMSDPWITPSVQTAWVNLKQSGDGWYTGESQISSTTLVDVHRQCNVPGALEAETVWNGTTAAHLGRRSGPQVFKVLIVPTDTRRMNQLTRLEVLKQMFNALINRILAYSFAPRIGLITVKSEAREVQALTHVIENFRDSIHSMKADGDTALWDGLALAQDKLAIYGAKFPSAKKRIICLSDGEDTKSSTSASEVYRILRQNNIVVDSICIGDESNDDLKTISHLLGSYCFKPEDMTSALAICEMEPMLSLLERPEVQFKSGWGVHGHFANAKHQATFTKATKDVYPPRKEHERLNDSFLELSAAAKLRPASSGSNMVSRSTMRSNRLLSEMQTIAREPNPHHDCYASETDMSFWKVVMNGVSALAHFGVFLG